MADPLGKVSRSGSYRHGGAAWRWRRRGSLTVLSGEEGGWWPAAAPVSFYNTDEGRWSLDTSQMNKNDTWGGAHQEGGATVLRRDSGVEKGPPWPVTASEVMGGRKSGGGGGGTQAGHFVQTGGDCSGALGGFNAGIRGRGVGPVRATPHGGRGRTGPDIPAAARERWRRALVG
jgi:hypothetical protein